MKKNQLVLYIKKKWNEREVGLFEWGILCLMLLMAFAFFYYDDVVSTLDNSVLFIKSIFNGEFFNFYQYSIDNVNAVWAANYEIPIYLIMGIWNLPTVIVSAITGFDYLNSTIALLWCKLGLVVCVLAILFIMLKIADFFKISKARKQLICFLFLSSIAVIAPVFIIAQYDCYALFFILLGLYYYIKDEKHKFMICFIIALPLKSFAIIFLPPLLLLKEKRLLRVVWDLVISMIGLFICKIIYYGNAAYEITMSAQYGTTIDDLFGGTTPIGHHQVLIFMLLYCMLVLFCYLYKSENVEARNRMAIYCCLVSIGSFIIFGTMRTYWLILLAPFMILLIVLNPAFLKLNLLLETIWGGTYALFIILKSSYVTKLMNEWIGKLLFRKIYQTTGEVRKYSSAKDLLDSFGIADFYPIIITIFIFCLVTFAIINFPPKWCTTGNYEHLDRSILWLRLGVIASIIFIFLYAYVATTGPVIVNSLDGDKNEQNAIIDCDVLGDEYDSFMQPITFKEDKVLHEITMKFENPDLNAGNMCSVRVVLKETDSGRELFSKRLAANSIESGEEIVIELDDIDVSENERYSLVLLGLPGVKNRPHYSLYVCGSTDFEELDPVVINGIPQEYCMALKIR